MNHRAPDVIAWVGVLTAFFAATIAVAQNDIKKILAYSTVSQGGYMFLAVGVGGYAAGVFHMVTHAAFKALLFLGAGSVIHGLHGEQNILRMGGLRKYMPITAFTFIIALVGHRRRPPLRRLLVQGRDPPRSPGRRRRRACGRSACDRVADRVLHEPQEVMVFFGRELACGHRLPRVRCGSVGQESQPSRTTPQL